MIPKVNIPEKSKGDWSVYKFEVPEISMENARLMRDGRGVTPGHYTKLCCSGRGVIMSDTDAEKRDHFPFVTNAKGHCLINGLGLGMCLAAALLKDDVEHVTVIESEIDVIDLIWPHYENHKCSIVHASAFDYRPPKGIRYGAVWHDIWDTICQDNYEEMKTLHRKYGRHTDWQGSWGRSLIERMNREDKKRRWYY